MKALRYFITSVWLAPVETPIVAAQYTSEGFVIEFALARHAHLSSKRDGSRYLLGADETAPI